MVSKDFFLSGSLGATIVNIPFDNNFMTNNNYINNIQEGNESNREFYIL